MISDKRYYFLLLLIIVVYIIGVFSPLMEDDSAQFAVMAMRMYQENDFINLIRGTGEYLDKPHLHFWLAALSYKIFGLHDWAYRIPSIIASLFAAYATFKLSKLLYNKSIGKIAALIFLTAQTIVLSNIDVRTDAVLTSFVILAIWQLVAYIENRKLLHMIFGVLGTALAFSTKGQIAIVVIGLCVLAHLLYTRKWSVLWSWKVLIGLVFFTLFISPMLYAYYLQFDLHPEKIIRGRSNRSGIFFILWEQSIERLVGDGMGERKSNSDYFFFFHTLLWEFLPWTLIMLGALYNKIKELVRIKFVYKPRVEFTTIGGILFIFPLISFAQYKLPHYLNVLIPLFSIFTAGFLYNLYKDEKKKVLNIILKAQNIIIALLVVVSFLLLFTVFDFPSWGILGFVLFVVGSIMYFMIKKSTQLIKIITVTVLGAVLANTVMNGYFYPNLLRDYQSGYQFALKIQELNIDKNDVYRVNEKYSWALDFYNQRPTPLVTNSEIIEKNKQQDVWLYIDDLELKQLDSIGIHFDKKIEATQFRVTRLSLKFLNANTRHKVLKTKYLAHVAK